MMAFFRALIHMPALCKSPSEERFRFDT